MGEKFNNEISKVQTMKIYSKQKQRALDDLATAYISDSLGDLDQSLIGVKSIRKTLRANGYSQQEIEDYLIQYSYITKTQILKLYNQSIYNEDLTVKYEVECIPAFHSNKSTTDLIIDALKNRPDLLRALKKDMRQDHISEKFKVNNPVLLKQFYEANKNIIELD